MAQENLSLLDSLFKHIPDIDRANIFETLKNFPKQVNKAIEIGNNISFPSDFLQGTSHLRNIVILGMGGSGIGGDLLKSYLEALCYTGNVAVSRNYSLPKYIDNSYLVIVSSYSGNTEETISGLNDALSFTKSIIIISTGGKLEKIAKDNNLQFIKIPSGFQPRLALGYSFFTQLFVLIKLGKLSSFLNQIHKDITELNQILISNVESYTLEDESNAPYQIALNLYKKQAVIYSSDNILNSVNLRWKGQIQENSKQFAVSSFLPEMNHNEINSFIHPESIIKNLTLIFLIDRLYHPSVKKRFEIMEKIFKEDNFNILVIESHADGILSRFFDLIYLGDWVSFYLAILNQENPNEIQVIERFKAILSSTVV